MQSLDPEVIEILKNGTKAERLYICEKEPMYFGAVHFPEFFTYPLAPFHFDFCEDYKALMNNELSLYAWIAFRESAKTSWQKILITHAICYRRKRFINYDSYDKENAEAVLFDVANWLMTKQSLIEDYGNQLKPPKTSGEKGKTIQRLSKFITTYYNPENDGKPEIGTMVQAFSTQEPVRGRLFNERRPDWVIMDDIETNKTKESRPTIKSIIDHFNEARTGLKGSTGTITVLGNLIIDEGVIGYIIDMYAKNDRARIRNIPASKNGIPAWPGKYTMTDPQAIAANVSIEDIEEHKISLESKERELKAAVFEPEMMNNPAKSGDLFFERSLVDAAITRARDPIDVNGNMKIWARFNPKHKYGGGQDTAEGIGGDANASVWIDFSTKPALTVATFEDNQMPPNIFGHEIRREGAMYGYPFIMPELNNTGYATLAELINNNYPHIYQREVRNKTTQMLQKEYGWKATVGTKFEVMGEFKSGFEDGELEILDLGLLEEMRLYRKTDARITNRDKGATRHFDKLRAAALAWHARTYAVLPKGERDERFFPKIPGMSDPYKL